MHTLSCGITRGNAMIDLSTTRRLLQSSVGLLLLLPCFAQAADSPTLNTGDTAWVLIATALVLMMTIPGLALFYSGMVRKKNILGTMAHEERGADGLFQLADLLPHGARRHGEVFRRAREVQMTRRALEGAQGVQGKERSSHRL